jgi:TM2 domain-containing membrane protein YozV
MGVTASAAREPGLYELLGVSPEATPERIDAAIEVAAADARVLQYASDPYMAAEAAHTLATLDHARRVLLDPYARRAYDVWRSGLEPTAVTATQAPLMVATSTRARRAAVTRPPTGTVPPLPPVPPRSKVAAAVLAFVVGWLGVHNFYLGRNGIAIAQLTATVATCGIAAPIVWVWAMLEGVLVLTGGIRDNLGRPLV